MNSTYLTHITQRECKILNTTVPDERPEGGPLALKKITLLSSSNSPAFCPALIT